MGMRSTGALTSGRRRSVAAVLVAVTTLIVATIAFAPGGGRPSGWVVASAGHTHIAVAAQASVYWASGIRILRDYFASRGGDVALQLGKPLVSGATVTAEVVGVKQGDKLYIQKMRRRKNYRRRTGHRQMYTQVKISQINAG